jgi:Fe-S cluster assembly protein SufD
VTELVSRLRADIVTTFTREAVEEISRRNGEPEWLRDRRLTSYANFLRLPTPTRSDEDYRRTDLRRLDLNDFSPAVDRTGAVASNDALPASVRGVLGDGGDEGGVLVQQNDATLHAALGDELRAKGVIFCSLAEAVERHPELVRRYFEDERVGADEDKWTAMNAAFWTGGVFVYVPSGVEATLPLRAVFAASGANGATFGRTVIVAEEWSQLTYVDDCLSLDGAADAAFNTSVVDVVAKEGSAVRYCHVQNWGAGVWNFERGRVFAHRDSAVNLLQIAFGSRLTKSFLHANIDEPGVSVELLGLVFIGGKQHIDYSTLQNHLAGQSLSDLLFKCAITEGARSVYGGLISIAPGAQRSDAYQNNRNLLLSESARADSIPMLEIQANDVRCTHGSTTSSVDDEELFYLQSRGLPRADAQRLIVEGFFSQLTDRVPLEGVKQRIAREIEQQIGKLKFD